MSRRCDGAWWSPSTLAAMRQHTALARWRRAGLPGARLLVLLAALTGLFAMHGMSDHGAMHHGVDAGHGAAALDGADATTYGARDGHSAASTVSAATPGGSVEAVGGATMSMAFDSTRVVAEAVATAGDALDGGLHVAMGLCLAILAGAAALALRRLCLRPHPLTATLSSVILRVLPSHARAPNPPNLHALCIQRC